MDKPPQRDVPKEVIIHYIVKDYQRMFLTYDEMKTRAEKAEAKIKDLTEKHASQLSKRDKEIEQLKQELEAKNKDKFKELEEKLAAAEERLAYYQDMLENKTIPDIDAISMKSFIAKVTRAFGKIDSAAQRIENFYNLVNGIPMV